VTTKPPARRRETLLLGLVSIGYRQAEVSHDRVVLRHPRRLALVLTEGGTLRQLDGDKVHRGFVEYVAAAGQLAERGDLQI